MFKLKASRLAINNSWEKEIYISKIRYLVSQFFLSRIILPLSTITIEQYWVISHLAKPERYVNKFFHHMRILDHNFFLKIFVQYELNLLTYSFWAVKQVFLGITSCSCSYLNLGKTAKIDLECLKTFHNDNIKLIFSM